MARVTGIGGVFFKADDPVGLAQWYARHLGITLVVDQVGVLKWSDDPRAAKGETVFATFPRDSDYFGSDRPFMVNFRVDDLDAMLASLRAAGVAVDDEVSADDNGRFGWATDPEGNRFELWEPSASVATTL